MVSFETVKATATQYLVPNYSTPARRNVTIGQALFSVALLATSVLLLKRDCVWSRTCKAIAGASSLYLLGLVARIGYDLRPLKSGPSA